MPRKFVKLTSIKGNIRNVPAWYRKGCFGMIGRKRFVPKPDHLVDPESRYHISRSDHLSIKT